jgi:hypothetical protein
LGLFLVGSLLVAGDSFTGLLASKLAPTSSQLIAASRATWFV